MTCTVTLALCTCCPARLPAQAAPVHRAAQAGPHRSLAPEHGVPAQPGQQHRLASEDDSSTRAQVIVHLLDYISVDYPEFVQGGNVLDAAEYAEQLEFAGQVLALLRQLPEHERQVELIRQAEALVSLIWRKEDGAHVAALGTALRWDLIKTYHVTVAPQRAPDVQAVHTLYEENCAQCHGLQGHGDGPQAAGLDPPPSNFHDRTRMAQRSVYSLYSTITLGVAGTAMASFAALSEEERWALAFYISTFATTDAEKTRGAELWRYGTGKDLFPDLGRLATTTVADIVRRHGEAGVSVFAYLRGNPSLLTAGGKSPLAFSLRTLSESLETYRRGNRQAAQQLAVTAYLEGFELVETSLDAVDHELRTQVEREMIAYRHLIQSGVSVETLEAQLAILHELLEQARDRLETSPLSPAAALLSAALIMVREGLEAILILAAVIAFLVKAGRRDALPYVHVGWVAALGLGLATWVVASQVISISGANRELTEGVTALLAAAVLLYVGFWLHGKAYAQRWQHFIATRVRGALTGRTLWALALVSFLAVYREVFETVLFYQALWVQADPPGHAGIIAGFVGAVVVLTALAWLIFRYSVRLPLQWFFGTSSILLAVLAVVLVGKGVVALQEAGALSVDPVDGPSVPLLGIYPNLQVLALQAALLCLIAAGFAYTAYAARHHP